MSIYEYEIEVLGWKDFYEDDNRRKYWIKLDCNIMTHPKIRELNSNEFKLFICILVTKGRQKADRLLATSRSLADDCSLFVGKSSGYRRQSVDKLLDALERFQLVSVTKLPSLCHRVGVRLDKSRVDESREDNTLSPDLTEIEKEKLATNGIKNRSADKPPERLKFDFESLYALYPRKEGKSGGLKKCKVHIKTQEDFDLLRQAIENYRTYCSKKVSEPRFIKHFSTFMGEWRDWLAPDAGEVVGVVHRIEHFKPRSQMVMDHCKDQLERVMSGEL